MTNYLRMGRKRGAKFAAHQVSIAMQQVNPAIATSVTQPDQSLASISRKAATQEHFVTSPTQTITLPLRSSGFDDLSHLGRTLVVLDIENINYSTTPTGFVPDYRRLMACINPLTVDLQAHAFSTALNHKTEALRHYLAAESINAHIRPAKQILLADGPKKSANSDNELLLHMGYLLAKAAFDTVIVGTGDGELGNSAVNFLSELPNPPWVYTLSVHGATAGVLATKRNPLVKRNLYWGQDLMRERQW
jgi:hypothetical protein